MRKTTKFLTLVLAVLMMVSTFAMSTSAVFTDVDVENDALYDAVELLSTLGVAKGTSETTFSPDELVTRQQMAAFIYRLMKAGKSVEGGANNSGFTDLADSTFFYMVSWAAQQQIIKGTSATTFNPTGNITLQDAYVMLVRALGYEKDEALPYPFGYIDVAEDIGLDEDLPSSVNYDSALTRGNVAIILANAFYADMNEVTTDYKLIGTGNAATYVPYDVPETICHKIFGVEEETFVVTATEHYALGTTPLYNDTADIDVIVGDRYDDAGNTLANGAQFDMADLGLDGSSDDYFLAEITLFVRKDANGDITKDEVIAAKSNLVKKTVTAADVTIERSTKTDAEYYVTGVKNAANDKVMTGLVDFGGIKAYLDVDNAPYTYRVVDGKSSVRFIDLTGGAWDEEDATFIYSVAGTNFDGDYTLTQNAGKDTYEQLTVNFETAFEEVYNEGLYAADVYDVDGDGYADYVCVKAYDTFKEIIDSTSKAKIFANSTADELYTKEATVVGEYESGDMVLAYVNTAADYIEIGAVVEPVEAMVTAKSSSTTAQLVTLSTGDVLDFADMDPKYDSFNQAYTYASMTIGDTYELYIHDGVLLLKDGTSSGNFDASANYAIVLPYDNDGDSTHYVVGGSTTTTTTDDKVVYTASGVQNGEFTSNYYVNVVIGGSVKAVQLSEYAYTNYDWDGTNFTDRGQIESQKITDAKVVESVMYHEFLNKLSTYTVTEENTYTFRALDIADDAVGAQATLDIFAARDAEDAWMIDGTTANIAHYTGNIYTISGLDFARFTLRDYSKIIIKTVDDDGEDVYTEYTMETLPKFATTSFVNVKAIFVNNKAGNNENLGFLYAEIPTGTFGAATTEDYRIITAIQSILGSNGNSKDVVTILDPMTGTVATEVEITTALTPAVNKIVALDDNGKATTTPVGTSYSENVIFEKAFVDYDTDSKFMDLGDGNAYVVGADTKVFFYTDASNYELVEEAEDILTKVDNVYIDLDELQNETFNVFVVAEESDDKNADPTIKNVSLIIVQDKGTNIN